MLREVALIEQTVALLHVSDDRASDRALIERVAAAFGDRVKRSRQFGVGKDLAWLRRAAVWQKRRGRHRIRGELGLARFPLVADDVGDRKAAPGVLDCGRDCAGQGDRAELREQLRPAFDDSGDSH